MVDDGDEDDDDDNDNDETVEWRGNCKCMEFKGGDVEIRV